jgi:protein-disulfide isomerase
MHKEAQIASEAAQCAHEQGKFWEYHDHLFANQRALKAENLKQYAVDLSLNTEAFNTCLDGGKFRRAVTGDQQAGAAVGVTGTPAFFVNGRFLNGAVPFETFQKVIDEELERSGS